MGESNCCWLIIGMVGIDHRYIHRLAIGIGDKWICLLHLPCPSDMSIRYVHQYVFPLANNNRPKLERAFRVRDLGRSSHPRLCSTVEKTTEGYRMGFTRCHKRRWFSLKLWLHICAWVRAPLGNVLRCVALLSKTLDLTREREIIPMCSHKKCLSVLSGFGRCIFT